LPVQLGPVVENHRDSPSNTFGPSSTRGGTKSTSSATTAAADFSLRRRCSRRHPFRREARSPRVRALTFTARVPRLRRRPLVSRASRSLGRSPWSSTPVRDSCSSPRGFVPRFLHAGLAVRRSAVPFVHVDQFTRGLSPPSQCPCRAHQGSRDVAARRPSRHSAAISASRTMACSCPPCYPFDSSINMGELVVFYV